MNILGFISAILIIFSIITAHMLKQHVDTSEINRSITGHYLAEATVKNGLEESLFEAQKEKKRDPTKPGGSGGGGKEGEEKNEESESEDEKSAKIIYDCTLLNLYPLIVDGKIKEKPSYELLSSLIKILYYQEIKDDKMVNRLIDALITSCKKTREEKQEICLLKIDLKDKELQSLWYKMLKGTKYYNFEKKIGFPSILEYVTFIPTKTKNKICLKTSSLEMLIALFDKKIAYKIWEKRDEKKKRIIITKTEFEKIINDSSLVSAKQKKDFWEQIDIYHGNHDKQAKVIVGDDDLYRISLRRMCRDQ
jgi:hypothetical protein